MVLDTQIAAFVGSGLLLGTFILSHRRYPTTFSLYWVAGWSFYTLRLGLDIAATYLGSSYLLQVGINEATATSAILILLGVDRLTGRQSIHDRAISAVWVALTAWIVAVPLVSSNFAVIHTPLYVAFGVIQVLTAYLFFSYLAPRDHSSTPLIVGSMAIWGLHKFDYPFLRPIEWIAPYGYMLGAILAFTTGLGVMMFLVEDAEQEATRERRAAARRQREYQDLFHNLTDPVYIHDLEGQLLNVNETAVEVMGYSRAEFRSMSLGDIVRSAPTDRTDERIQRVVTEESVSFQSVHETKAGDPIPVEVHATEISYRGETAILGIARDISQIQQREQELHDTAALLETVINTAPVGIMQVNERGKVELWNPEAEEIFGYSEAAVLGDTPPVIPDDEVADFFERFADMPQDQPVTPVEVKRVRKDGSKVTVKIWAEPTFDSSGGFTGAVGVIADISERKRREQQLEILHRVFRHNIRNAVTPIKGYSEMVAASIEDESLEAHARRINRQAEKLEQWSDEIQQLNNILRSTVSRRPIRIDDVVASITDEMADRYPEATLSCDCDEPVVGNADGSVKLAVSVAIENAIEHNDRPEPSVELAVTEDEAAGQVEVTITDDGPGIPEEERAVLRKGGESALLHSSGVGLWMIHLIVDRNGGEVTFDENEPRGSSITLKLPSRTGRDE